MLILASKSNSRRILLENAGLDHHVIVSDIDESNFVHSDEKQLVKLLANAKARAVFTKIQLNKINNFFHDQQIFILGCDSLFSFKGKVFGKPKTHLEAIDRLKLISGKGGELHTGHTLILCEKSSFEKQFIYSVKTTIEEVITTKVFFSKFSDFDIQEYVDSHEPMECAGGFSLERKGGKYVERIDGCFSNVIGLSLPWLRKNLSGLKST